MKKILFIILLLFLGCKDSKFTQNSNDGGKIVKKNTFINSPGIFYFGDIKILVKKFNDESIIYGVFDYNNELLYQRNINASISDYMKWTIYIDNHDQIWFYNSDYQDINVFVVQGKKGIFIKEKNKLPSIPLELSKFIKD